MILFTGKTNIYSQFYTCEFIIGEKKFNCAEQWMMYSKAIFFNDEETAQKILNESSPKEIKQLGREVKGYDDDKWILIADEIVYMGNLNKFNQNPELKEKLLKTGNKLIYEAMNYDKRWGTGFDIENSLKNKDKWGENRLGKAIMRVRETLIMDN